MPGAGAFGPYKHGHRFRVVVRARGGEGIIRSFATEGAANRFLAEAREEAARDRERGRTVASAIKAYGEHQREKGNRERGMAVTKHHLDLFFASDLEAPLDDLTHTHLATRYRQLRDEGYSVDYHRNVLAESRSLLGWCVKQGWIAKNPLERVEGVGRRRKGKAQLTVDESRVWAKKAFELARKGDAGAIAALCSLLLGMRAGEIVERVVRDLDDAGRLLHITSAKTEAGVRTLEVPELLRPLLRRLAKKKFPQELLFGKHWRDWPRENVQRICRLAKVPQVTAHGMRGLNATLAMQAGATAHLVAEALGHESETTTLEHYADKGKVEGARRERALKLFKGGKR